MLVCVRVRMCVFVLFLSGPCLCDHSVICCSGHSWTSRPDGFKGGAGRQWSSREGEIMPNLPNSVGCKDSQWNCFVFAFIRCPPGSTIFAAQGNCITLEDIIAIFSCRSFDLIRTRVVIFSVFLQGPDSGFFFSSSWSSQPKGALDAIWTHAFVAPDSALIFRDCSSVTDFFIISIYFGPTSPSFPL